MANHRKEVKTLSSLSKRQWLKILCFFTAIALLIGGLVELNAYRHRMATQMTQTAYSVTDRNALSVSRSSARDGLRRTDPNATYVTVKVDGTSRAVVGKDFTTVKSVLEQGDITLEPGDVITPALNSKVKESTVVTISRAGSALKTSEEPIVFNTVRKETAALPKGQEKVQTEGSNGVMETTSLVTKAGGKVISSNVFTSYVKTAPVDKVILVGTGSGSGSSAGSKGSDNTIGTTVPVGEMQQWAHDYLLSNGYSEEDFTATVFIISHESGWNVHAQNPSGAYGLPQALPGSKMASAGADWHDNYQTQLRWFWSYCQRYGGIQGAYRHWLANGNY